MTCTELKVNYLCLEQNKFGGAIYNFPKQKVVMSHPLELPLAGLVKFSKIRFLKKKFLHYGINEEKLIHIKEDVVINLKKKEWCLSRRDKYWNLRAKKVIMAMGVHSLHLESWVPGEDSTKSLIIYSSGQYQPKITRCRWW